MVIFSKYRDSAKVVPPLTRNTPTPQSAGDSPYNGQALCVERCGSACDLLAVEQLSRPGAGRTGCPEVFLWEVRRWPFTEILPERRAIQKLDAFSGFLPTNAPGSTNAIGRIWRRKST